MLRPPDLADLRERSDLIAEEHFDKVFVAPHASPGRAPSTPLAAARHAVFAGASCVDWMAPAILTNVPSDFVRGSTCVPS